MKDEELRALEREFVTEPGAAACLRLARALERVGRHADVPAVLRRGRAHPEVRRALTARVWAAPRGPGSTWASAALPVAEPEVRWSRPGEVKIASSGIAASPSIVASIDARHHVRVLDAATGSRLWTLPAPARNGWALLLGGAILVAVDRMWLRGHEPRTGKLLWELPVPLRLPFMAACDDDAVVLGTMDELRLMQLDDPVRPPVERWRAPLEPALWRTSAGRTGSVVTAVCGAGLVGVGQTESAVLDAATGARRFGLERRVVALDEGGVIAGSWPPPALEARDPYGAELPLHGGPAKYVALGPDVAVVRPYTPAAPHAPLPDLLLVDRRTWEVRALGVADLASRGRAVLAGDQLHLVCPHRDSPERSSIAAVGLDGRLRWRLDLDLPRLEEVESLAVTDGRLHVCTSRSTVLSIGERSASL